MEEAPEKRRVRVKMRSLDLARDFKTFDIVNSHEVQVPGTKISFFDYFNLLPRCAICHEVGF